MQRSPSQVALPQSLLNSNHSQTPLIAFCSLEKEKKILKKKKKQQPGTKKDWQLQINLVITGKYRMYCNLEVGLLMGTFSQG